MGGGSLHPKEGPAEAEYQPRRGFRATRASRGRGQGVGRGREGERRGGGSGRLCRGSALASGKRGPFEVSGKRGPRAEVKGVTLGGPGPSRTC